MASYGDDYGGRPAKRQRIEGKRHHRIQHRQQAPNGIEPAPQDGDSIQSQLYRALSTTTTLAGFDGIAPSALESLKGLTEEFIVSFLETVCTSMIASRRTTAIPQDFILALAELSISPSDLTSHLGLNLPEDLSYADLTTLPPASPPPADLQRMLGSDLCGPSQTILPQVPSHFPPLPSKHTWRQTPFVTPRERDPRKIRERATQEGIVAEQNLRRLQAAAQGPMKRAEGEMTAAERRRREIWMDAWRELAGDEGSQDASGDVSMDGGKGELDRPVMVVNSDRAHWRKGAALGATRS